MRLAVYLLPVVWLAVYRLPAYASGAIPVGGSVLVARCAAGSVPFAILLLAVYLLPDDAGWQCTCCQLCGWQCSWQQADAAGSVSFAIVLLAVYLLPADAGSVPVTS